MEKIVIIGAGFAGLACVQVLSKLKRRVQILLIDKSTHSNFLPLLPDIIGRGIKPENLTIAIEDFCKRANCKFVNAEVTALELEKQSVVTKKGSFSYDYLVIASGSETNFYGNNEIKKYAYKLGDAEDARVMFSAIKQKSYDVYIVVGGGYTGVEIATNLRRFFNRRGENKQIIIVERATSLLGSLPIWMKEYVIENLRKLDIRFAINCVVNSITEEEVVLSDGRKFNSYFLVWSAGVKTADFVQNLNVEKTPQGRLKVDEYLRINKNCFAVGDAANFLYRDKPLRMAVQFSIFQAKCVARNIMKSIYGAKLKKYRPIDLGYVIPMANNRSCGKILGVNFKGSIPTILHYFMCIYRSYSFKNRVGIIRDLLKLQPQITQITTITR